MVEEKKIGTPDEESNIDQINKLVTGSEDTDDTETNKPEAVELNEESEDKENLKEEHKKSEHKPVHHVKPEKKVEVKKEQKPQHKVEHKIEKKAEVKKEHKAVHHNHVKEAKPEHKVVKAITPAPVKVASKKSAKEVSKPKKIISIKKPSKEEKMVDKKTKKKDKKTKFKLTKNTLIWISIGVLAAILVIALILILMPKSQPPAPSNETVKGVAATVNGEPIYLQDVLKEYNSINPLVRSMYSVESVLNKTIDDTLLYQEAKTQGYKATPDEIQAELDAIKTQNQLTDAELENALTQQGLTLDAAKTMIEKNLMVRKFLNATVLKDITVTEGQIEKYYLQNLNKFAVPAKVTVQHILILTTDNSTDAEAKTKIEQVQKELTPTNFCELVTKYSEDQGSLDTCGKYTFAKGDFNNPDFENPSFDLRVGEVTIVKTTFGYHLIKKLEDIPATTLELSEVSEEIKTALRDEAAQTKFDALLANLKAKAVVVNYMTKQDISGNDTTTEEASLDTFAKCITEKGAVFYGASWCSHCNNQKKGFGDSMQYIKYVECAVEGQPQVQTPECTQAGISGYPTWIVNGKSYPGEQQLTNLAKLTGCTLPQ